MMLDEADELLGTDESSFVQISNIEKLIPKDRDDDLAIDYAW